MIVKSKPPGFRANQVQKKEAGKRSQDSDDDIAEESEAASLHDLSGQPTSNKTDQQCCNNSMSIHFVGPLS
jgi:hypothetical protein